MQTLKDIIQRKGQSHDRNKQTWVQEKKVLKAESNLLNILLNPEKQISLSNSDFRDKNEHISESDYQKQKAVTDYFAILFHKCLQPNFI